MNKLGQIFTIHLNQHGCHEQLLDASPPDIDDIEISSFQQYPNGFPNPFGKKPIIKPTIDQKDCPLAWIIV